MATKSYKKFKGEFSYSITEITRVISKCSRGETNPFNKKFTYSVMLFDVLNLNLPFTSNIEGLALYSLLDTFIDVEKARMLIDTNAIHRRSKEDKTIGNILEHICRQIARSSNYEHFELTDRATWFFTKVVHYMEANYPLPEDKVNPCNQRNVCNP